jgi:sugar/nucleoside kinase (ribokinase family)
LNGVDDGDAARNQHEAVLGAALSETDVLHANAEEAEAITGIRGDAAAAAQWYTDTYIFCALLMLTARTY